MGNSSNASAWSDISHRLTAQHLAAAILDQLDLLVGVESIRALGPEGEAIADEVLQINEILRIRLGWQLFSALLEGSGIDPDALMLEYLPLDTLDRARAALLPDPKTA